MGIKTDLNIAPYFDDYDITKKYYRVLFKPGFAVQARELTQLQTTLQNQIEQFGENIYKEGSIIKGCTFTELRDLKYVKVVDQISTVPSFTLGNTPENFRERTVVDEVNKITYEYYYEIEDETGLKAIIVEASSGFLSRDPDLNTFFISYLNTSDLGGFEKKQFEPNDVLSIREWYIIRQPDPLNPDEFTEETQGGNIVATTTVASFSNPVGQSFGLNVSEGVIFQRGHFLFVDDQTIVVKKYISATPVEFAIDPNNISVGYVVDESIVNSQQDASLLDNATGSPNENAPGADRLLLVPRLVARDTTEAEADNEFFILRRYENGLAIETRDVSEFNSIGKELARRTFETNGDYTTKPFSFQLLKSETTDDFYIEMSEGVSYSQGYRVSNNAKRLFLIPPIENTETVTGQPINFTYGGYVNIVTGGTQGHFAISPFQTVKLYAANGTTIIGSAVVNNYTPTRLYMFAVRMASGRSFSEVVYVGTDTDNKIQVADGIEPKIIDAGNSRLLFELGRPFVKSVSAMSMSIRKVKVDAVFNNTGGIVINPGPNEAFDTDSLRDVLVIRNSTNVVATLTSPPEITLSGALFIQTNLTGISGATATVYYNTRVTNIEPRVKQPLSVYVKTSYTSSNAKYTLGLPDAVAIESIVDESGKDYTGSFLLNNNQKANFYDHSYIQYIPGTPTPETTPSNPVNELTVKVKVLKVDGSSSLNVFTVNSYETIDNLDIPYFVAQDGRSFDLKSCIDFRPYRMPTANYATNEAGATLFSSADAVPSLPPYDEQLFAGSFSYTVPALGTSGSATIEYYGARTDYIVGTSLGRFKYITGDSGSQGGNRLDTKENSIIAEIKIPGYPILTAEEAFRLNRRNETVSVSKKTVNTYTMKDIDDLSKRVDKLTYYVVLSALEASAKNLAIKDENGLNRFKNGIIVDAFNDLSVANVGDPKFGVSIDSSEKAIYPSVNQFTMNVNLKEGSENGTSLYGPNLTLAANANNIRIINQQYASDYRTCTSNFWKYTGSGKLYPEYDVGYDTVTTPQTFTIDLVTPFASFTEALGEILPLTVSTDTVVSTDVQQSQTGNQVTTETTSIIQTLQQELAITGASVQNTFVGDFVSNIEFKPYMRRRQVAVSMYGLRPNTRHHFFFDGVKVDKHVAPGALASNMNNASLKGEKPIRKNGIWGAEVKTNANGELFAIFRIPAKTFIVGERELIVTDVDDFGSIASASSSKGKLKYNAYNFGIDKVGLTQATRAPVFDIVESTTTRTVVDRQVETVDDGKDPLAQTFFVKETMTQKADALYVSYINLYFKRKSLTNGVTVMIREVENGYPSKEILPFSIKHLKSSEVNVSDDSSAATPVVFDAPIRLEAEKEYAIVIMPDAADPDYLVFIQKVGRNDLLTGEPRNSDWGDGVLFTSTNNRAWKSYQNEDLKFEIFRYNFNVNSGTAELENADHEFITTSGLNGQFQDGELAYTFPGTSSYQVSMTTTTNVIVGSTALLSVYQPGDYLYVESPTGVKDLLRVTAISISGSNANISVNKIPEFAGLIASRPVVAGTVIYFNKRRPNFMVLEDSSARLGRTFLATDIIRGIDSGAFATIASVDDPELSYIQAMVNRVTDSDTNVKIAIKAIDPETPNDLPYTKQFSFGETKRFIERGCKVFSKSNDITKAKNLKLVLTLEKDNLQTTTPVVDVETAQVFAYIHNITNDADTTASYISKRVELQEGFNSEDFRIYLTAYRPPTTDIKVYIRVKNEADPTSIEDNDWIELERLEGESLFSNRSNLNDFKEFVYGISAADKNGLGQLTYTNATGTYTTYRSFAIRIDLLSPSVAIVPKLLDYRGVSFE